MADAPNGRSLWPYYAILCLAGGCVMTLELVAGRLVAPSLGVSLYTWTGVIGAVLTGMSLGSLCGGWLADRRADRPLLGWLLAAAGTLTAAILPLQDRLLSLPLLHRLPPLPGIFLPLLLLFGVPAFAMAAITPLVYRLALAGRGRVGSIVGRLTAAGSLGSVAGTYATGFWLIPAFGTHRLVLGIAAVFLLGATAALPRRDRLVALAALLIILLPLAAPGARALSGCTVESAYYCIRVSRDRLAGGETVQNLILDDLVHGGILLDRPRALWYDYQATMGWLASAGGRADLQVFAIGGGAYLVPAWIVAALPAVRVEVAEIDPAVTRLALAEFATPSPRLVTRNQDARLALAQLPPDRRFDLILGDAFGGVAVPYHLTTLEFTRLLRQHLTPRGLYVANVADRPDGAFLAAYAATLRQVFPHVYLLPGDRNVRAGRAANFLLVAAGFEIPWAQWRERLPPPYDLPLLPLPAGQPVLTDDHAPVEGLLLPVFDQRWRALAPGPATAGPGGG